MKEREYMSDEELFNLIDEIEASGVMTAPGGLKETVLDALKMPSEEFSDAKAENVLPGKCGTVERPPKILELRRKYRRSCIQIGFAAAACALFLVIISGTGGLSDANRNTLLDSVKETRTLSEIGESRMVMKQIGGSRLFTRKIDEITKEPEKGE